MYPILSYIGDNFSPCECAITKWNKTHSHSGTPSRGLTKTINPVTQSHRYCSFVRCLTLSQQNLYGIRIDTPKDSLISSVIHKYPDLVSSVLLFTLFKISLTIFCLVLLLILIMVRPCFCFLLMWSVHSLLTFFLQISILICFSECQMSRQIKFPFVRNPNF